MIVFNDPHYGTMIAQAAGAIYNPLGDANIASVIDGELAGGITYTGYTGASIGLHVAGFRARWSSKDILWSAFHYPFVQLGCQKIFGQVAESNVKALEFDLKLGFKVEARIRDVFNDGDLLVLGMYREDCRWLKLKPSSLMARPGVH